MKWSSGIAAAVLLIAYAAAIDLALGQQTEQTPMEGLDGRSAYALIGDKERGRHLAEFVLRATARMGTAPIRNTPSLLAKQQITSITSSVHSSEGIGSRMLWQRSRWVLPISTRSILRASTVSSQSMLIPLRIQAWPPWGSASFLKVLTYQMSLLVSPVMALLDNHKCRSSAKKNGSRNDGGEADDGNDVDRRQSEWPTCGIYY